MIDFASILGGYNRLLVLVFVKFSLNAQFVETTSEIFHHFCSEILLISFVGNIIIISLSREMDYGDGRLTQSALSISDTGGLVFDGDSKC